MVKAGSLASCPLLGTAGGNALLSHFCRAFARLKYNSTPLQILNPAHSFEYTSAWSNRLGAKFRDEAEGSHWEASCSRSTNRIAGYVSNRLQYCKSRRLW